MSSKKITIIIFSVLFIITLTFSIISINKINNQKILPTNKKLDELEELKNESKKLDKEIKLQKRLNADILKTTQDNLEKKEQLEKVIYEHQDRLGGKVVYLTFDDGPSEYTQDILSILDKYNVKATFFVTCSSNLEQMSKLIVEKGHTIALHTCTHKYSYVYSSDENYFQDLNDISNLVENYTGIKSRFIRLPGGSSNTVSRAYNKGIMTRITYKLNESGYKYYDWNIDSNDAGGASSEQVYANVIGALQNSDRNINMVLMHDTKVATKDALDRIIKDALDMGYTFSNINEYTKEVHHGVNN